jgi:hypothetical protein
VALGQARVQQQQVLVQQLPRLPVTTLLTCWVGWTLLLLQWAGCLAVAQPSQQQPTRWTTCWGWVHQQQQQERQLQAAWMTCWALAWRQQQHHQQQRQTSWACLGMVDLQQQQHLR